MIRVAKLFEFEASHQLPEHDGKCKRLHGHSYKVEVVIGGDELERGGPKNGMLVDFGHVKALVKPIIDELDHTHLNDNTRIAQPPTAERIATFIVHQLVWLMSGDPVFSRVWLESVRVWETSSSWAEWTRGA